MKRYWKRWAICAAIAFGGVAGALLLAKVEFFQLLDLKARDAHFVLRGARPTRDIVIVAIDDATLNSFPEPTLFWGHYYADAIRAAVDGGGKVFVLDVAFNIPVAQYDGGKNDEALAKAFNYASSAGMPLITAFEA